MHPTEKHKQNLKNCVKHLPSSGRLCPSSGRHGAQWGSDVSLQLRRRASLFAGKGVACMHGMTFDHDFSGLPTSVQHETSQIQWCRTPCRHQKVSAYSGVQNRFSFKQMGHQNSSR